MPRITFAGLAAAVMLLGFGIAWLLTEPPVTPLQATVGAHFEPVKEEAKAEPRSAGADSAPGWEKRDALRDRLKAALIQFDARPCDEAARAALFKAYADRTSMLVDDAHNTSDGESPAFWRTAADLDLDKRIEALIAKGSVTQAEMMKELILRRAPFAKRTPNPFDEAAGRARCGPSATAAR